MMKFVRELKLLAGKSRPLTTLCFTYIYSAPTPIHILSGDECY
jgi:hypothetical protein